MQEYQKRKNELNNYIKQLLMKGYPDHLIRKQLGSSGWKETDYEEELQKNHNISETSNYIDRLLKQGYNQNMITKKLESIGWDANLVNQIFLARTQKGIPAQNNFSGITEKTDLVEEKKNNSFSTFIEKITDRLKR